MLNNFYYNENFGFSVNLKNFLCEYNSPVITLSSLSVFVKIVKRLYAGEGVFDLYLQGDPY